MGEIEDQLGIQKNLRFHLIEQDYTGSWWWSDEILIQCE